MSDQGWGRTRTGRKWHYIRDGAPLCNKGKWDGFAPLPGGVGSIGNECHRCVRQMRRDR